MAPAMVQVGSTQEATGTPTCSLSLETQESEDMQEGTIHVCGQLRTEEAETVKSYRQRHGGEGALEGLALHPAQACGWRADCGGEVYWEDPELTSASPTATVSSLD